MADADVTPEVSKLADSVMDVWFSDLCAWKMCQKRRSVLPRDFAPIPMCDDHIYEVWNRVEDVARRARRPKLKHLVGDTNPPRPRAEDSSVGFIYYIRVGALIKVGYTSNLLQRMRAYPPDAEWLGGHQGTRADEKVLHSLLTAFKAEKREWYVDRAEVIDFIEKQLANRSSLADPRKVNKPAPRIRYRTVRG